MQGIKYIFQKEMARVFKDKKMIFSLFILPVVLIIGMYTLMGTMAESMMDDIEDHKAVVEVVNAPESFKTYLNLMSINQEVRYDSVSMDKAKEEVMEGSVDLILEFPEGFEADVAQYNSGDTVPQVKSYYNPSEDYSSNVWSEYVVGYLEAYRQALLTERVGELESIAVFTVDSDNPDQIIQDDDKASGKMLGMMIPYLITILLFAGAMSLGIDSITGEKERGTLASLLLTPVKRTSIVLGKVFSLMVLSAMSAATYVIGLVIAMPMMMKGMVGDAGEGMSLNLNPVQIVQIAVILISLVFLYVSLISIVAVFAKTTKEGSSYVMPIYIVVIAAGIVTMFGSGKAELYQYCIPMYNSSLALKAIFARELGMMEFAATAISNLIAGGIVTGIIARAFNSEKVMFNA